MIVDLEPTEDQRAIADGIAALLDGQLPVSRLRDAAAQKAGAERAIWDDLTGLGLFGLGLAEADGGVGLGLPEEVLAAEALGAHLASPLVVAQIAAAHIAGGEHRAAIVSGTSRAAFGNPTVRGDIHIIDGDETDLVLILSETPTLVTRATLGAGQVLVSLDETIALSCVSAGPGGQTRSAGAERISLLLAAYMAGLASAATDMAVEYAKTREQFGQPIGAFQAIKHMCADMAVRAAAADAQVRYAAVTFDAGIGSGRDIAAARLLASEAAITNAKANIQIHGGMGFTAECDAHLFLKRAHLFAALGSSRRAEERRLIEGPA